MLTLHGECNRCSPSRLWCITSAARPSSSACLPACLPSQGMCTACRHVHVHVHGMCKGCSRYTHGMHVHGMCTACARHVQCVGICSTPPLSDNSCWDDGNPIRAGYLRDHGREAVYAGCPPFSPPLPSPPPSPPHSDRQRRLRSDGGDNQRGRLASNTSSGHYSGGKVHIACACACT